MPLSFKHLSVFVFFIVLTILLTWPLCAHLSDGYISPVLPGDAPVNIWNVYIFKSSVASGINPFYTHKLFFPEGANLLMHGYVPAMGLFSAPFSNSLMGMNIYLMLHFVLSAFGAYLLSFRLTRHTLISVLVGIAFGFSAYKMLRLTEHYMLVLTATVPFYIIAFLNAFTFREGSFFPKITSWKYVLICLGLGLLSVLNDYYTTFYLVYFSLGWALYYKLVFYWKAWNWKKRLIILISFFIGMHLLIEPIYQSGADDRGGIWWGGDLVSYIVPNENSWLWDRDWFSSVFTSLFEKNMNMEFQLFIGYSMIILLLYLIWFCIRYPVPVQTGAWVFMLILFFLISLPVIKIAGVKLVYSPTSILHFIPFFNNVRCNGRIIVLITLVLPLAAAIMWSSKQQIPSSFFRTTGILILLGAGMLLDVKPLPYHITAMQSVPPIYEAVKNAEGQVLTPMPTGIADGIKHTGAFNSVHLFYQTYHHKSLSGGYVSRIPDATFDYFRQDSIMSTILKLSENKNALYTNPAREQCMEYFKRFKTDLFLIEPGYRNTNAEKFIDALIIHRKHHSVEKGNYRLIILE